MECKYFIKLSRFLEKKGFHRDLITNINIENLLINNNNNILIFFENISQSFFIDPFEIQEIERIYQYQNYMKIKFLKEFDLEKPEYFSNSNEIILFHSIVKYIFFFLK